MMMKTRQKRFAISTVLLACLLLLVGGAPLSRAEVPSRQPEARLLASAGAVGIRIETASTAAGVGDVFEFGVWLDAGSEQVMAIDAAFDFDPAYLEVVDSGGTPVKTSALVAGKAMPMVLGGRNVADNAAGTINYSAGAMLGGSAATGSFLLASGYLRAKAETAGTMLLPHYDASNPSDYRNVLISSPRGAALPSSLDKAAVMTVGRQPVNHALYYGLSSTLNGKPLPAGSRITICGPQGVECAEFAVKSPGVFGPVAINGDDSTTPQREGAQQGDTITFRVNGIAARALGPDDPTWTKAGDVRHVELATDQSSPSTGPTATPAAGQQTAPTATPPQPTPTTAAAVATATPVSSPTSAAPPAASPTSAVATATQAANTPAASTSTPAGSQPAPSNTPPPAGGTSTAAQPSPVPGSPESTPRAGSTSPPSTAGSPTPGASPIPAIASPTPAGGVGPESTRPAATPAQLARLPVGAETPGNPASRSTSDKGSDPDDKGAGQSVSSGSLAMGAAAVVLVLALTTALVLVRRRYL